MWGPRVFIVHHCGGGPHRERLRVGKGWLV